MNTFDRHYLLAVLTPFALAVIVAIYTYIEFHANGITSPNLWIGVFLVAFFAFVTSWFVSLTMYLWIKKGEKRNER